MGDNCVSFTKQDLEQMWQGCIDACDDFMRNFLVTAKPVSFNGLCLYVEAAPFLISRFADPQRQESLNNILERHTGIPNASVKFVPREHDNEENQQNASVFPAVHINTPRANENQNADILSQFQAGNDKLSHITADLTSKTEEPRFGQSIARTVANGYAQNSGLPPIQTSASSVTPDISVSEARRSNNQAETMLQTNMTFDTYICGENNQLAVYTARAVAEKPGEALNLNPLFFYGGVGLGKTHLMNAIGNYIREHFPEKRVYYISAEQFMSEYIRNVGNRSMDDFKQKYRYSIDTLLIDDIQFLEDKEKTQDEFFHTFEYLRNNHKQIVIASDRPVELLPKITPRLQSRLQQGMVADIQAPKLETRIAILMQKAQQLNFTISDDVLYFIADSNHANVRELEGALTRVWTTCTLQSKPITIENAMEALKVDMQTNDTPDPQTIMKAVCDYFKIDEEVLTGAKRDQNIAKPRQIAMYLMRKHSLLSLEAVGAIFKRNHTTVLHAVRYVEENIKESFVKNSLMNLRQELKLK